MPEDVCFGLTPPPLLVCPTLLWIEQAVLTSVCTATASMAHGTSHREAGQTTTGTDSSQGR